MSHKGIKKIPVIFVSIIAITSIIALTPNTSAAVSGYTIVSVAETGTNEVTVVIGGTYCPGCNPNDIGNPGCPEFSHGSGASGEWVPGDTGNYWSCALVDGRYAAACIGYGLGPTYVKQKFICNSANWPLTVFTTKSFVFSGIPVSGGDTVNIYGEMYCSWCGHWYATPTTLIVKYGPVADADGPYTGYINTAVPLDGSGSYHTDSSGAHYITAYDWDLDNDGQYDDATGMKPSFTWTTAGTYPIALRVTDDQGITDTDSTTVTIIGPILVSIDIKPGSCPNPLNTKDKGVLPIAICGTKNFDVSMIDLATIKLKGVSPLRWSYEDVATPFLGDLCCCHTLTCDGYLDLSLKFSAQAIVAALGTVNNRDIITLTLTGKLVDGTPIEGQDCVWIIIK